MDFIIWARSEETRLDWNAVESRIPSGSSNPFRFPVQRVSAEAAFNKLSAKMIGRLAQWNQGEHFATIRTDWLSRAAGVGGNISVRLPDRELAGLFETVDEIGQLVLVEPEGTRHAIAAADVVQLEWPRSSNKQRDGQSDKQREG